tara:strand:- start:7016 stop:7276 length:261 start_codon:yes stop_codon:yes gene_type:complete
MDLNQLEHNHKSQLIHKKMQKKIKIQSNSKFTVNQKVRAKEHLTTHEGTIYESDVLRIKDVSGKDIKVEDQMGKKYWLNFRQLKPA